MVWPFSKKTAATSGELTPQEKGTPAITPAQTPRASTPHSESEAAQVEQDAEQHIPNHEEVLKRQPPTVLACTLGAVASIGGFMFGYESGQISGMLQS